MVHRLYIFTNDGLGNKEKNRILKIDQIRLYYIASSWHLLNFRASLIGCPIHSALGHIEVKRFVNYYSISEVVFRGLM